MLDNIKNSVGLAAVILTFVGYIPYIKDTIKGKTKPHIYSWFLWAFITFIIFFQQVSSHAGAGSLVTLATAILCLVEFILGLKNGEKDITKSDTVTFIVALVSTGIWLIAKQPIISNILLIVINTLAIVPTIRKSWGKPYSETLFSWSIAGFRNLLGIISLETYSIVTWLYPASSLIVNLLFSIMLIIRRKQVNNPNL